MKITTEIDSKNESDKLTAFFKTFKINAVEVISRETTDVPVVKGDKKSILQAYLECGRMPRDLLKPFVKPGGNLSVKNKKPLGLILYCRSLSHRDFIARTRHRFTFCFFCFVRTYILTYCAFLFLCKLTRINDKIDVQRFSYQSHIHYI